MSAWQRGGLCLVGAFGAQLYGLPVVPLGLLLAAMMFGSAGAVVDEMDRRSRIRARRKNEASG